MPKFFSKKESSSPKRSFNEPDYDQDPVKTILTWNAPSRPFRQKDKSFYTTIAIIAVLIMLIALLAQEFLLIGVVLALCFVVYVLGFIPPEEVEYKVSTQGVTIGEHFYFWGDLDSFWLTEKDGHTLVNILTHLRFPGMLTLILGNQQADQVRKTIAHYVPFREIAPKSTLEKWADSLQKHFPLENPR